MFDRLRNRHQTDEEQTAARDQRRADREARRLERLDQSAERRAASVEAEARRQSGVSSGSGTFGGGPG